MVGAPYVLSIGSPNVGLLGETMPSRPNEFTVGQEKHFDSRAMPGGHPLPFDGWPGRGPVAEGLAAQRFPSVR